MKNLSRKELIDSVSDLYELSVKRNSKTKKWQVKDGRKTVAEFNTEKEADTYKWDAISAQSKIQSQRRLRSWLGI